MKIIANTLASTISGAIDVFEENGRIRFSRFSSKQQELANTNEGDALHSKSDSGVKIDFITNSKKLSFSYTPYLASGSTECFIDICVDKVLKFHVGNDPIQSELQTVSLDLGDGVKRVTMYFPCLFYVELGDFELDDDSTFEPVKNKRKFLVLGDSITQGCNAIFPSLSYPNLLGAKFDAEVVNQAIAGDIYRPERLDENLKFSPDTIFIAYGTNDWGASVFDRARIEEYYKKLTMIYPSQKIYTLLPIWRKDIEDRQCSFVEARRVIADICSKYSNISVIDTIDFVPHYSDFFYDGFLHPNDLGFIHYANAIEKAVREIEKTN